MDHDGVRIAFNLILEEIGSVSKELKEEAKRLVDTGDFDQVKSLMETGKKLDEFQLEVKGTQGKWISTFDLGTRSRTTYEPPAVETPASADLNLMMTYQEARARARIRGREVTVLPGSRIRKETFESMQEDVLERKRDAIKKGELVETPDPHVLELKVQTKFSSPSDAAIFVAGCSVNGRKEWRVENQDISLKEWQEEH